MTTYAPVANLRATPLPQIGITGVGGNGISFASIPITSGLHLPVPIPGFNPNNQSYWTGHLWPMIPIKPLPTVPGTATGVL